MENACDEEPECNTPPPKKSIAYLHSVGETGEATDDGI